MGFLCTQVHTHSTLKKQKEGSKHAESSVTHGMLSKEAGNGERQGQKGRSVEIEL